eukprot:750119-Hanusia_phi.AAC.4
MPPLLVSPHLLLVRRGRESSSTAALAVESKTRRPICSRPRASGTPAPQASGCTMLLGERVAATSSAGRELERV